MKELLKKIWNFILKLVALVIGAIIVEERKKRMDETIKVVVDGMIETNKTKTEIKNRHNEYMNNLAASDPVTWRMLKNQEEYEHDKASKTTKRVVGGMLIGCGIGGAMLIASTYD